MDGLNKQQLILLALFCSFITSIATGIVTVTLLDQAPRAVTQTINRVVERTIETVVAGETKIVNTLQEIPAEARIVEAVQNVSSAFVRIIATEDVGNSAVSVGGVKSTLAASSTLVLDQFAVIGKIFRSFGANSFEASGFLVSDSGTVVTTSSFVLRTPVIYTIVMPGGGIVTAKLRTSDIARGVAIFDIADASDGEGGAGTPVRFGSAPATLGQTIITFGYDGEASTVSIGFISALKTGNASSSPIVKTSIASAASSAGAPIITTNGELVGMFDDRGTVIVKEDIQAALLASMQSGAEKKPRAR